MQGGRVAPPRHSIMMLKDISYHSTLYLIDKCEIWKFLTSSWFFLVSSEMYKISTSALGGENFEKKYSLSRKIIFLSENCLAKMM